MFFEKCDMHMHTTESDGSLTGLELLELASKRNLKKLSVTDHDDIDFYLDPDIIAYMKKNNIEFITGCEFVCSVDNMPIEILGYGIDLKEAGDYLSKHAIKQNSLERFRSENAPKVFFKKGFKIDYDPSKINFEKKDPGVLVELLKSVKRNKKLCAEILKEEKNALNNESCFLRNILNNVNSKFYMDTSGFYPSYIKIIDLIHQWGGLAFLAHPYQYGKSKELILKKVKEHNIDGIECYHFTTKNIFKRKYLIDFCKKNNLMISGGSDFHYPRSVSIDKSHLNELNIPDKIFNDIKKKLEEKHNKKRA